MRALAAALIALLSTAAAADTGLRIVDNDNPILDGGVWGPSGGIPNATVRIDADTFVLLVHTNAYGQFSLSGLAPGIYRVETDQGHLIDLIHGPITITEPPPMCDLGRLSHRTFDSVLTAAAGTATLPAPPPAPAQPPAPAAPRGHVDTTSTTQVTRIDADTLRSLP